MDFGWLIDFPGFVDQIDKWALQYSPATDLAE